MNKHYNTEVSDKIVCPYCGFEHEPMGESRDILEEGHIEKRCVECNKPFVVDICYEYQTETLPGLMTDEEWEKML